MSTVNPDETARNLQKRLSPFTIPALVLGIAAAPVIAAIQWLKPPAESGDDQGLAGLIFLYVIISVALGLFAYYVTPHRVPLVIAAYSVAYVAGLMLVLRSSAPFNDPNDPAGDVTAFVLIVLPTIAAIVLFVLYFRQHSAQQLTASRGVDTTATVESAGIDGMVNYVTHQKLTLSFTDDKGTKRFLRIGRTGGGWSAGDTMPLRYDPERPWAKHAMIIGN